ncbi:S41 family peptidase [Variovorax saccharolyticus]|uniref:S41 family peptidase n=1 Tax=Variovorax saccharolyticus TaxID=3053516 RepID=UPI00257659C7|nr:MULTISPECIES: S41 family peptidase [unclassified Variovorax]MDM0021737.1 S41 family peptidase [Variovorax sp. J22R187]MDM0028008.1 S41 family peptidase [Variovorax sp. J31P216]
MRSVRQKGAARCALGFAAAAALCVLAACGGGGGGGGGAALPLGAVPALPAAPGGEPIGSSASLAGRCASPRLGVDPDTGAAFPDQVGSVAAEKNWVRAWIDESYLWYSEVPVLSAADYATPIAYFDVLKTPKLTASGRPKDRFHFAADTSAYREQSQAGTQVGYGVEFAFLSAAPPRDIRVAYTEPGSPAAQAALDRGLKLIGIDGIDVVAGTEVAALNAALAPTRAGQTHSFRLQSGDGSVRAVTLSSTQVARMPVQNVKTIATATGAVGYLLFNDHVGAAEGPLIAAVNALKAASVSDLVIDMRYNGGGLLEVASELAFMVATPEATNGTVFERLKFNDRNPFGLRNNEMNLPFYGTTRGYTTTAGDPLPQLGLSRVTVLAGPDTCSASESVVNGLRGVGITVNLVGAGTCGKPYGFFPQDNCGTTYFAIQFQGVNQLGFGDYGDGFAPTCAVADDFDHALGDPAEARLAAALALRSTGACPAAPVSKSAQALGKAEAAGIGYLLRPPARESRILARP